VLHGIEEWERKEAGRLQQREPGSFHEPAFGNADQRSIGN
jgi:hypothetical protein